MNRYREFYKDHKDGLFNYLMRMTGDYELARDLMQESFTRYLEHYKDKPQDANAWLRQFGNPYQVVAQDLEGRADLAVHVRDVVLLRNAREIAHPRDATVLAVHTDDAAGDALLGRGCEEHMLIIDNRRRPTLAWNGCLPEHVLGITPMYR